MRTTLKRGIGQAAGLNGNGHSGVPPLFGPIVRYKQPDPPPRSLVGLLLRGFGWLVLALAVVASGAAGGAYLYLHETLNAIGPRSVQLKHIVEDQRAAAGPAPVPAGDRSRRRLRRPRRAQGAESLCRLQLRHADARSAPTRRTTRSRCSRSRATSTCRSTARRHAAPRRTASTPPGRRCSNGPAGTLDTVEKLTGLPINYLITLDFHAFKQIVNHLHGVYMNVDRRYFIAHGHGHVGDQPPPGLPEARRQPRRCRTSASATPTPTSTAPADSSSSSTR